MLPTALPHTHCLAVSHQTIQPTRTTDKTHHLHNHPYKTHFRSEKAAGKRCQELSSHNPPSPSAPSARSSSQTSQGPPAFCSAQESLQPPMESSPALSLGTQGRV